MVSPISLLQHQLPLVKMASQASCAVAVQYERMLSQHIRNLKGEPNINGLMSEKVDAVETAVIIHFSCTTVAKDPTPIVWASWEQRRMPTGVRSGSCNRREPRALHKAKVCASHASRSGAQR